MHTTIITKGSFKLLMNTGFIILMDRIEFVSASINMMIPWLFVMFSVIFCDLMAGISKSQKLGEEIRLSRAFRDTMSKMVTYFSFVVMVVFIENISNIPTISKWSILFICFIEGCSIISNILKPKGYSFDVIAALGILLKKLFSIDKEDVRDVIKKDKEEDEK